MNQSTRTGERSVARRRALAAILVAVTGLVPALAAAQAWPTKAVRVIVPFPPGGAADASARVLGEVMAKSLGQPIVVENRPGAGSIVGTQAAAQSNDGHTLLMGSTSMTILPALRHDLAYDVQRDFQPISMVSAQPLVLAVAAGSPIKTLEDVVARGKTGDLTSGNSGNGTLSHLTTELFNLKMGTKIVSVPYKGENALVPDIVGGTIGMGFVNLPSALPLLKAGRLRAIVVTSAAPLPELPGIRTLKAAGMQEGVIEGWAALFAAKDVPAAGVQRMEQALRQALADPAVKERFASLGVEPRPGTQAQLRDYVKTETARWGEVVRSRHITLD
jgi:tripartite-type tricarboxylate transporter receptor subunit TctC